MAIAVFGPGFLGHRLCERIPGAVLSHVDIGNPAAVRRELRDLGARAAINAAGKTGRPNVDWCETHRFETARANALAPLLLAETCADAGVYLLHVGSGCIFNGAPLSVEGWRETDPANPSSFYARTKYAADLILGTLPNVGIARLRMPVDGVPGPRNLITKLAGYSQVIDVSNSITVVDDFIRAVEGIVALRGTGVFHVTNPGTLRHAEILRMYRDKVDSSHTYELIEEAELVARGLALHPRSNCTLADSRLEELGITLRPVEEAVSDALDEYARQWSRTEPREVRVPRSVPRLRSSHSALALPPLRTRSGGSR